MQALDVAHWASLPSGKQAELYGRRALVFRAANQPAHAFADWLHAAQVLLLLYHASSNSCRATQCYSWHALQSASMCVLNQGFCGRLRCCRNLTCHLMAMSKCTALVHLRAHAEHNLLASQTVVCSMFASAASGCLQLCAFMQACEG